jgi:hypothetical protein
VRQEFPSLSWRSRKHLTEFGRHHGVGNPCLPEFGGHVDAKGVQSVEELVELGIGVSNEVVRRTSGLVIDVFLTLLSDRAELPDLESVYIPCTVVC